jgi:hypothetical protein
VVNATPRPLPPPPPERPGIHCIGGWVGLWAGLNGCGKSGPPLGFDPRTDQPVASRYIDLTIPAPFIIIIISSSSSSNSISIITEFLTSQLELGTIHLSWDLVIIRIRLGGLIYSLESFLQSNMCRELQIFAFVYMYSDAI